MTLIGWSEYRRYAIRTCLAYNNMCHVLSSQALSGHNGYLSSCSFLDEGRILTASGDATCNLWDIEKGRPSAIFRDHSADVMSLAVCKTDPNLFVSGSCDSLALVRQIMSLNPILVWAYVNISNLPMCALFQIWDIRTSQSVLTLRGHTSDLNAVTFFPGGGAIGTGSDDHTCRIFDMRCVNELAVFGNDKIISSVTSGEFCLTSFQYIHLVLTLS